MLSIVHTGMCRNGRAVHCSQAPCGSRMHGRTYSSTLALGGAGRHSRTVYPRCIEGSCSSNLMLGGAGRYTRTGRLRRRSARRRWSS